MGLYAEPLPRSPRYPEWLVRVGRSLHAIARLFAWAPVAILFGVVGPAACLVTAFDLVGRHVRVGKVALFATSMLFLVTWIALRPRSPRFNAALCGGLLSTALYAIFNLPLGALLIGMGVIGLADEGGRMDWWFVLLGVAPFLGAAAYGASAWNAWTLGGRRITRWLVVGFVTPLGLAALLQGGLNLAVGHCIERMLSDDRDEALAAADACRHIPRSIVRWKPLANAWLEEKGWRMDAPETERSERIADVFERLTGRDLRRGFDDSADF